MTNKEAKRQSFLEATAKLKEKKRLLYEREPEQKLYDEGKIAYSEYLKRYKERKQKERENFKGNKAYEEYDNGLITYDEFLLRNTEK
ncbi:hypothetical protein IV72_GL000136 [Atopobium minutum]|uniref:hypothetical protein n=1 Tax=Atopobium minutum TaxID=1381 RepID=UPI0007054516|nr:hypothetical protein [Atopobium minutum]KRN53903.1 hypothetical protein IV72_GL000136 [Atopobium minutum]